MIQSEEFARLITSSSHDVARVIEFDSSVDELVTIDLSVDNDSLLEETFTDIGRFSAWIEAQISVKTARYGIGGYNEHRKIYAKSQHFNLEEEPRRLHLGVDIWGPAGSPIYSVLRGKVHSCKFNDNDGDYGGTIITQHSIQGLTFFILYGHLSFRSISLQPHSEVVAGQQLGVLGTHEENGNWPPHLHFQIIFDLQGCSGDYPGVCKYSEASRYLSNCPDPGVILQYSLK